MLFLLAVNMVKNGAVLIYIYIVSAYFMYRKQRKAKEDCHIVAAYLFLWKHDFELY